MNFRIIILGIAIVAAAFIGATLVLNGLWPSSLQEGRPQLVAVPPLPALAGTSTVLAPAAIAMSAIRDALEAEAPRNLSGHPQNPVSQLLQAAEPNFTITRGPLAVTGRPDALVVSTPLNGTFQARGTLTGAAGALGNTLGNMLGGNLGAQVQGLNGKAFDQHADFRGTVTAPCRARPLGRTGGSRTILSSTGFTSLETESLTPAIGRTTSTTLTCAVRFGASRQFDAMLGRDTAVTVPRKSAC